MKECLFMRSLVKLLGYLSIFAVLLGISVKAHAATGSLAVNSLANDSSIPEGGGEGYGGGSSGGSTQPPVLDPSITYWCLDNMTQRVVQGSIVLQYCSEHDSFTVSANCNDSAIVMTPSTSYHGISIILELENTIQASQKRIRRIGLYAMQFGGPTLHNAAGVLDSYGNGPLVTADSNFNLTATGVAASSGGTHSYGVCQIGLDNF